jgi:hypothetical protein
LAEGAAAALLQPRLKDMDARLRGHDGAAGSGHDGGCGGEGLTAMRRKQPDLATDLAVEQHGEAAFPRLTGQIWPAHAGHFQPSTGLQCS